MIFREDNLFTYIQGSETITGTYMVNFAAQPVQLDIQTEGSGKVLTIIEFREDHTIRMQNNEPDKPRPTSFTDDCAVLQRTTQSLGTDSSIPPAGEGLLLTASLDLGIEGWQQWLQGGSQYAGQNEVRLVDDPTFGKVVEFSRVCEPNDGGAAGLYQTLNLDVSSYSHLYIWLVGKVLQEEGGNLANQYPQWYPEGAVQVRIKYLTTAEKEKEWYHGFYVQPVTSADTGNFTQVTQDEWFHYTSPDLMSLPEPPMLITDFRVYGFGWQFLGQVAEVNLIGSP
jgi:hypothetical protein